MSERATAHFSLLLGFALLVAQPAAGQISGSLEKLIVDLPTGCTTRSESTKPDTGGTFTFSYTCLDRHDVTFIVSLPSSVSATSFHDSWYELASPANAIASASWKWTTPATVPGGSLFSSAGLRLYLSTHRSGASCAADEVLKFFLRPGVYTFQSALPCSVTRMEAWSSGEPGDTTPWARYWASTSLGASDGVNRPLFPVEQVARVTGIYRMGGGTGADLSVQITGTEAAPGSLFPRILVRNSGPDEAREVVVSVEVQASESNLDDVPDPACRIETVYSDYAKYLCPIGNLPSGQERVLQFTIYREPGDTRDSNEYVYAASAAARTEDPDSRDNSARKKFRNLDCHDATGCLFILMACEATTGRSPTSSAVSRLARGLVETLAEALDIGPLYRLRDDVFAKSAAGRRYTELYYAHTAEVAGMLVADSAFRHQLVSAYDLWKENVGKLVDGQGAATVITQAQVDALLGVLARLESAGSPELKGAIAREKSLLSLPSLVGKTMEQGVAAQEATTSSSVTVPAAASIHGIAPAFFHSDVRVFNPSPTATADVTAHFRCFTGPCPTNLSRTFSVAPREMKVYDDILATLFGAQETAGPVEFEGPVLVESRVYTPTKPAPTTGSAVPGVSVDQAFGEAILTSLSHSHDSSKGFRTNVGVYNPNDAAFSVTFELFSAAGVRLGSVTRSVGARTAVQVSDVFRTAGLTADVPDAYAIVRADGIAPLFAYATVIDNRSLDSVFVPGRNARGAPDELVTIPASASIHGVPPAFFHSDARVFNPSASSSVDVSARFRCFIGPCPVETQKSFPVGPREMKVLDDLVASLFGAQETAGALELFGPVLVDSRIYTPSRPDPTTGTGIPGVLGTEGASPGVLLALSHSADRSRGFRTNIGVHNPEPISRAVTITLHLPGGTKLAELARTLPPSTPVQVSDAFGVAGISTDVPDAYAIVTAADGRPVFAYATVIDNQTQDSVFVGARRLP